MITARKFLNSLIKELNYSSFCEIGYHNGETTEAINLSNDQKVSVDPSPDISTKYITLDLHLILAMKLQKNKWMVLVQ